MLSIGEVSLRAANRKEFYQLWYQIYVDNEWKTYDAPFYPVQHQSKWQFYFNLYQRLKKAEDAKVISLNGQAVGYLTWYWEDKHTRWLEVGITVFSSAHWGKRIGRNALILWITHLFQSNSNLERVGLSTWSGNPRMMKCAERIGMKLEGRMRKVRYYQGQYFDAIRYGVLREEWLSGDFGFSKKKTQPENVVLSD